MPLICGSLSDTFLLPLCLETTHLNSTASAFRLNGTASPVHNGGGAGRSMFPGLQTEASPSSKCPQSNLALKTQPTGSAKLQPCESAVRRQPAGRTSAATHRPALTCRAQIQRGHCRVPRAGEYDLQSP